MSIKSKSPFQIALDWRLDLGLLNGTECVRLFYGPGEAREPFIKDIAIDRFGPYLWITQWQKLPLTIIDQIIEAAQALKGIEIRGAVLMDRSDINPKADSHLLWGEVPDGRIALLEHGCQYGIQLLGTKHPGLFLDHAPLRQWLSRTQSQKRVLNLFAYTGSLSVAAGMGGAKSVTTLDLSKPTIEWAKENWALNPQLQGIESDFIFGDVFEWLPKFIKKDLKFDTILCDPPSFSRTKSKIFSTQKDLKALHELIFQLLAPGGTLATSINSENIPELAFMREIDQAAQKLGRRLTILKRLDLPETFPTRNSDLKDRYLKGFIVRAD
jgi:23S rRNA (cytosine1962-C5)-methyltransferase